MEQMIKEQRAKIKDQNLGFTLIETLISVAILGLITISATSLFFISLKAKKKMEAMAKINQSGNYALAVIDKTIKNAKKIEACIAHQIEVKDYNNNSIVFLCDELNKKIFFNGSTLVSAEKLTGCSFDCDFSIEPNTVLISFTLETGTLGGLDYASQTFRQKTSLRKY